MSLTKQSLIEAIQNQTGLPKNKATEIVESIIEIIKGTLATGEDVLVSGFGKFPDQGKRRTPGTESSNGRGFDFETAPGGHVQGVG